MIAIFSDLHLSIDDASKKNKAFLSLLTSLPNMGIKTIWFLGDIYDLFIGPKPFWKEVHRDFFKTLEFLHQSGCEMEWFEGNHDFHLEKLLLPFKISYNSEDRVKHFNNKKIYVGHGDNINKDDFEYLRWRRVIKSKWFRKFVEVIPNSLAEKICLPIAQRASAHSRDREGTRDMKAADESYRKFSEDLLLNHNFDAVIVGHHHATKLTVYSKNRFYLNLGVWNDHTGRYAIWSPGKIPQIVDVNF